MNSLLNRAFLPAICAALALAAVPTASAQLSFTAALAQALEHSPRVKTAQDDLKKAKAEVGVMKDIYVPSVVVGAGLGAAHGIMLSVPTIFTVTAQSLVYSPQQFSYIRGAKYDVQAATYALADAREQVAEDAAITYLTLNHDQQAVAALSQESDHALKLVNIVEDRVATHLDAPLDLKKTRRDALEMRLQLLQMQDDLDAQAAHLAVLTGLPQSQIAAQAATIPDLPPLEDPGGDLQQTPGMRAAEASQKAREMRAHADAEYTWRPNISFGAQYGRISPVENVSEFYNLHGEYNTLSAGVQFTFPLLDKVRMATARQSAADAAHGAMDLASQQQAITDGLRKLRRATAELSVKAQVADLDYGIAEDELQSVLIAEHGSSGSPARTPEDEQNARIQERQKYLELLDTRLDAARASIDYMRQTGQLEQWLHSLNVPATLP